MQSTAASTGTPICRAERYSEFVKGYDPATGAMGSLKALVYLQDGAGLQILPRTHLSMQIGNAHRLGWDRRFLS